MGSVQEELDAERLLRTQAEQRVQELSDAMTKMQQQFQEWQDAEKQRQEQRDRDLQLVQEQREVMAREAEELAQARQQQNQAVSGGQLSTGQLNQEQQLPPNQQHSAVQSNQAPQPLSSQPSPLPTGPQPSLPQQQQLPSTQLNIQQQLLSSQPSPPLTGPQQQQLPPTQPSIQRAIGGQPSPPPAGPHLAMQQLLPPPQPPPVVYPPPGFPQQPPELQLGQAGQVLGVPWWVNSAYYPPATAKSSKLPFSMTCERIPKFSGEGASQPVAAWIRKVDESAGRYEWEYEEKFLAATGALAGPAKKWFDGLPVFATYEAFRVDILKEFGRKVLASDVHHAMRNRKKRANESLLAYVQEMRYNASQADIAEMDVRNYIVNGVTDDLQVQLTLLSADSDVQFMNMLDAHERKIKERVISDKSRQKQKENGQKENTRATSRSRTKDKRCYNCKEFGHIKKFCPELKNDAEEDSKDTKRFNKQSGDRKKIEIVGSSGNRS